jgi:hypothetical protein
LKGAEGDIYSWIWFLPRAALFTTGGRASKGCHLTQAAETGAARNIALLWNLNAIEITDNVVPAFLRRSISW